MAISDTITSMYENVGNVYDVLELAGADLTNVDKNIENLKQSWEERLLYFLANGTDVVWNNWLPKVTGSGTEISLNNTIEAKMDFVYKGNTSQNTTEGKNLANVSVTNKVPSLSNGQLTNLGGSACTDYISIDNTKEYVFSYTTNNTAVPYLCFYGEGNSYLGYIQINSSGYKLSTYSNYSSTKSVIIRLDQYSRYETIQLEQNSTATSYEEYTGGVPSPNPDYPQDIHVVSGDNTIDICGKNLLKIVDGTYSSNGITAIANNEEITLNGTATNNAFISFIIDFKKNDIVSYSANNNETNSNVALRFFRNSTSGTYGAASLNVINKVNENITLNQDYDRFQIRVASGTTLSNFKLKPMIVKGTTVGTYEQYIGKSYPIQLGNIELCKIGDYQDKIAKSTGKNLFDKDNANIINAVPDTTSVTSSSFAKSFYIPIKPNTTYTISREIVGRRFVIGTTNVIPEVGVSIIDRVVNNSGSSITFTSSSDVNYLMVYYLYDSSENETQILSSIQVELGSATSYEPYGKVWYLNKQIGKVVLDGSEDWSKSSNTSVDRFLRSSTIPKATQGISNYFNVVTSLGTNVGTLYFNERQQVVNYSTYGTTTLATFKTWLGTHNTTVYYVLATPTTTEITDTTLISQLEVIKKSYNTQTNISQENSKEAFILDVTALGN